MESLQKDLKEKQVQLQQVDQTCRRQKVDLENRAAKVQELDQLMGNVKKKYEESREEILQLTQHIRTARSVHIVIKTFCDTQTKYRLN